MPLNPIPEIDRKVQPAPLPRAWIAEACQAGFAVFDDPRIAAAAALASGANRLIFTGAGAGYAAASFGATAFRESGFDTRAVHADDLAASSGHLLPGDVLISIDSNSPAVAKALRKAHHAGVATVGITTRDLAIINPDILAQIPGFERPQQVIDSRILTACCLTLALVAARLEPGTRLAGEVARTKQAIQDADRKLSGLQAALIHHEPAAGRLILAGKGSTNWVVDALASQINTSAVSGLRPVAVTAHSGEIDEGRWRFAPDDILIEIDAGDYQPASSAAGRTTITPYRPQHTWTLSRRATRSPQSIHLPGSSQAMASLVAFSTLTHLFEEILSNVPHPA